MTPGATIEDLCRAWREDPTGPPTQPGAHAAALYNAIFAKAMRSAEVSKRKLPDDIAYAWEDVGQEVAASIVASLGRLRDCATLQGLIGKAVVHRYIELLRMARSARRKQQALELQAKTVGASPIEAPVDPEELRACLDAFRDFLTKDYGTRSDDAMWDVLIVILLFFTDDDVGVDMKMKQLAADMGVVARTAYRKMEKVMPRIPMIFDEFSIQKTKCAHVLREAFAAV